VTVFKRSADERGTPFIEVDAEVVSYVNSCGDACVMEMASRMMKSDGELSAIFPFQRLGHTFIVTGLEHLGLKFDPEKERRSVDNVRKNIREMKVRILRFTEGADASIGAKAQHYLRMLDVQLEICDKQDRNIDMFDQSRGR